MELHWDIYLFQENKLKISGQVEGLHSNVN